MSDILEAFLVTVNGVVVVAVLAGAGVMLARLKVHSR